jgi:hypothetical protein
MKLDWLWPPGTIPGDQLPASWGRYMWTALHAGAERVERDPHMHSEVIALIRTLRDVLPCMACRKSLRATLSHVALTPETNLVEWLKELEAGVTHRLNLQAVASSKQPVPREERPPMEAGEVEMSWVLAYCLRGAGGRSTTVIAQWANTFRQFVLSLVRLLDPIEGSLLHIMGHHIEQLQALRYDPYRFLERCVTEQVSQIKYRKAERRAARINPTTKGGHPHGPLVGTRPQRSALSAAAGRITHTKVAARLGPPVRLVLTPQPLQHPRVIQPSRQVVMPKTEISSSNRGAMQPRIWRKRYPRAGSVH